MHDFTPYSALLGGTLIGLAASLFLLAHGRIAGISGILGDLLRGSDEHHVRLAFVGGLFGGGVALRIAHPSMFASSWVPSIGLAALSGLIVGFGTQLGNGCTSGHGVCGVSRLSTRSLVATGTFMLTGFMTVFATRHLVGGIQ